LVVFLANGTSAIDCLKRLLSKMTRYSSVSSGTLNSACWITFSTTITTFYKHSIRTTSLCRRFGRQNAATPQRRSDWNETSSRRIWARRNDSAPANCTNKGCMYKVINLCKI